MNADDRSIPPGSRAKSIEITPPRALARRSMDDLLAAIGEQIALRITEQLKDSAGAEVAVHVVASIKVTEPWLETGE